MGEPIRFLNQIGALLVSVQSRTEVGDIKAAPAANFLIPPPWLVCELVNDNADDGLSRSLTLGRCRNAERQADPSRSTARAFERLSSLAIGKSGRVHARIAAVMRFGSCRMALSAAYTVFILRYARPCRPEAN